MAPEPDALGGAAQVRRGFLVPHGRIAVCRNSLRATNGSVNHNFYYFRNRMSGGPDEPYVSQFDWVCFRRKGIRMIPVIIDTGSAALNGLFDTLGAALHGLVNTLWTGSFGA